MTGQIIHEITASSPLPPPVSSSSNVRNGAKKSVIMFWAPWHEPSSPNGSIDGIFNALASSTTEDDGIVFYKAQAESVPELSQKYQITVIPSFLLLDSSNSVIDRVDGGDDVSRLTQAVTSLRDLPSSSPTQSDKKTSLRSRLQSLITSSEVMLFMKGDPSKPRCGFIRQALELLNEASVEYGTFDILEDEDVRQGLKEYSDWPTYPQLYAKGELIGGLDIMKEMVEDHSTDFGTQIGVQKKQDTENLNDRLKKLVTRHQIMLFMKGLPSAPRCGFSRQIVEILDGEGVSYDSFNILEDEDVRQGLKEYSDWPTYPQLYVNGDLVGGLDIVKEMVESGDLSDMLKG